VGWDNDLLFEGENEFGTLSADNGRGLGRDSQQTITSIKVMYTVAESYERSGETSFVRVTMKVESPALPHFSSFIFLGSLYDILLSLSESLVTTLQS
jgi:hypothetical protein